jgi:hypothetical protein
MRNLWKSWKVLKVKKIFLYFNKLGLIIIISFFSFNLISTSSFADSLKFNYLTEICSFDTNLEANNRNKEACHFFIRGYLEIANHNCQFDLFPDQLHKLNTKGIKFDQIIKALKIYAQKNTEVKSSNAIDHLWNIFNKLWPCRNK